MQYSGSGGERNSLIAIGYQSKYGCSYKNDHPIANAGVFHPGGIPAPDGDRVCGYSQMVDTDDFYNSRATNRGAHSDSSAE